MSNLSDIECWRALGRAIVVRTIQDYQQAKRELESATLKNRTKKIKSCLAVIQECEEFLRSGYCKTISNIDGKKVLEVIDTIRLPENPVELDSLIRESPLQTARAFYGEVA